MIPTIQTQQTFRIHVIAASPAALLAILSIAGILGIEPQQAADRLASLPTVLTENVAGPEAQRLSAVLMAFGLNVRLDPTFSTKAPQPPAEALADLAVQLAPGADAKVAASRLHALLGMPEAVVLKGLTGPEGLVLRGLSPPQIIGRQQALRRDRGLRLTLSDPASATFDAFPAMNKLLPVADLMRLGLARCPFSGAAASGLNHATALYLSRRVQDRLTLVNRDFQRFDLLLRATHGLAPKELSGFLESRPGARQPSANDGLRQLEIDLPRRVAMQFAADYATIGVEVQPRLRGLVA